MALAILWRLNIELRSYTRARVGIYHRDPKVASVCRHDATYTKPNLDINAMSVIPPALRQLLFSRVISPSRHKVGVLAHRWYKNKTLSDCIQ
jgi:hypothetical protein